MQARTIAAAAENAPIHFGVSKVSLPKFGDLCRRPRGKCFIFGTNSIAVRTVRQSPFAVHRPDITNLRGSATAARRNVAATGGAHPRDHAHQPYTRLKIATTLAVIGAVVAEFVAAERGLGFFILFSTSYFKIPQAFAGLAVLVTLSLVLFRLVGLAQRWFAPWSLPKSER
jgi:hypothetical protein